MSTEPTSATGHAPVLATQTLTRHQEDALGELAARSVEQRMLASDPHPVEFIRTTWHGHPGLPGDLDLHGYIGFLADRVAEAAAAAADLGCTDTQIQTAQQPWVRFVHAVAEEAETREP